MHTHAETHADTCTHTQTHAYTHTHTEILMYAHIHSHKDFFFHFKVYFQSSWLVVKWTALFLNYILTILVVILPGGRNTPRLEIQFPLGGFSSEGIGEWLDQGRKGKHSSFYLKLSSNKGELTRWDSQCSSLSPFTGTITFVA